ncbi:MAG: hypothetical protein INR69_11430 [Mucilaginibacter polytrichastri]|nr:hypothetical protein [Mucilaginibacter polytrichastri]
MPNVLKLTLAFFLLLCLFPMPYGFYIAVRFGATAVFALLAFRAGEAKNDAETFAYIVLAVLFQPFEKVMLGRLLWNVVDFLVAAGLVYSVYSARRRARQNRPEPFSPGKIV